MTRRILAAMKRRTLVSTGLAAATAFIATLSSLHGQTPARRSAPAPRRW